ncbi:MAG: Gmad2 immunoglobulin-like domain-containing protein [Chloroflexia bacterium]
MSRIRWLGLFLLFLFLSCGPATPTPTPPPATPAVPTVGPKATSAVPAPTAGIEATPAPTPVPNEIRLESPSPGAVVFSPVEVRGWVRMSPFESTLLGRVLDGQGNVLGQGPIQVAAEMGQPGPFSGQIFFQVSIAGPGRVEVLEVSPKDGAVMTSAAVEVVLNPGGRIEIPAAGARTTLPLHILARLGRPGEPVVALLRWQDGTELARTYTLLEGEDGGGLLIESLWWEEKPPAAFPPTQPATLLLRTPEGTVLAQQEVVVLHPDDPDVQQVTLYFLRGEELAPVSVRIPRTVRVGTAALEELLWGPPPNAPAGLGTALPLPPEVLRYPGRGPDWGPRVRLLSLTIQDGVARADFSRELRAYGGGSLRVLLIRQQITRTLQEFPSVREVIIAIEGETEGVLEP